ncbi:MAG: MATE family efflux transporter [Lentisphaerales bacterium]|nr:MATE family efflux transporter [Lentisphaerales bacterium]
MISKSLTRLSEKDDYSARKHFTETDLNQEQDNTSLLNEGPVFKAICSIMLPMAIMMTTNVAFSYLDAWYISRLGSDALNAMDISFPLINLCSAVLYGGLGTGVSVAVARKYALKDHNLSETCLKTGLVLAIPLSLLFTFGIILGKSFLFTEARNEISRTMAYDYCFWYFLFITFMAVGAVTSSAMRGAGYAKRPAIYSLICMALNALFTPIFAFKSINLGFTQLNFGLDMGIKGAAISTVVVYTIFTLFLIRDLIAGNQGFKIITLKWQLDKQILKDIFKASSIAALLPLITNLVIIIILKVMSSKSDVLVDAFSLAKRFELYLIQLTVCLGAGTMVVMGASHATENYKRVREVLRTALKVLFLVGIPITLFMVFGNEIYYSSLTQDEAIIAEGKSYFLFASLNMLFTCAIILMNFSFQGISKPAKPIPFSLFSVIVIQGCAGIYLISQGYSSSIYYALISVGTTITFCLILNRFLKSIKETV